MVDTKVITHITPTMERKAATKAAKSTASPAVEAEVEVEAVARNMEEEAEGANTRPLYLYLILCFCWTDLYKTVLNRKYMLLL